MELLIWCIIVTYCLAELTDWGLHSSAMEKYRQRALIFRQRLADLDTDVATRSANAQFQRVFSAIYYPRFWSWQRVMRSSVSSTLSIIAIYAAMTVVGAMEEFTGAWDGLLLLIVVNLIADYLSLQETGWILRKSQRSGIFGLAAWSVLDLLITGAIWFAVGISIFSAQDTSGPGDRVAYTCLLSTYVTSLLWMGFFVTAVVVRGLKRTSPVFRAALKAIGESQRPARTTAGIVTLSLAVAYGLTKAASWALTG